jgi:hypothetical protein
MVRLLIYIYIMITITESRVLACLRPTDHSRRPPSAIGAVSCGPLFALPYESTTAPGTGV